MKTFFCNVPSSPSIWSNSLLLVRPWGPGSTSGCTCVCPRAVGHSSPVLVGYQEGLTGPWRNGSAKLPTVQMWVGGSRAEALVQTLPGQASIFLKWCYHTWNRRLIGQQGCSKELPGGILKIKKSQLSLENKPILIAVWNADRETECFKLELLLWPWISSTTSFAAPIRLPLWVSVLGYAVLGQPSPGIITNISI